MVFTAFFERVNPVSTIENPSCMNITRNALISSHARLSEWANIAHRLQPVEALLEGVCGADAGGADAGGADAGGADTGCVCRGRPLAIVRTSSAPMTSASTARATRRLGTWRRSRRGMPR